MKWFKHDSTASMNGKLKRLRFRYGMEGYGLYWYCVEIVSSEVDQHNLTFELDHDAEIIAHDTGIHYEQVQEMMQYMIKLKLFENNAGSITCLSLAKRLDQSMTSNAGLRKIINSLRNNNKVFSQKSHDGIKTEQNRTEQNRTEQNRTEQNREEHPQEHPQWLNHSAWLDFEQHRKEIKKPLTDLSRKKNWAILYKHQHRQEEIINLTISQRWTGLFEPKGADHENNPESRSKRVSEKIAAIARKAINDSDES